ncbi:hypothetical protein [Actinophytocola sp.]|uniref:hypothetical protein n=1 Tax=Actinophytocola sp. TaxID=1872138 RepID=UPI003D6A09EA
MTHQQQQPVRTGPTRRKVILTGAGIAAAGVAVGAGVPLVAAQLSGAESGEPVAGPEKPVMVHLRDAASGRFDIFVGTERIELTDPAFASRLSGEVRRTEGK